MSVQSTERPSAVLARNLVAELAELLGFDVDVISDGARGVEAIAPVIAV